MNDTIPTQLPPRLIQNLRETAQEEMLPTLAALDRTTRAEIRLLLRSILTLVDRSENWKPPVVSRRFYFAVDSNQEARLALDKLASLGCTRYTPNVGPEQVTAIFVSKAGEYSFVFNNVDRERYFGELQRDTAASARVDIKDIMAATSLSQLVEPDKSLPRQRHA